MVIYAIVCSETLKLYVGQHKHEDRLKPYLASKFWDAHHATTKRSHLYNAMRKHPRDSWSIHPLISGIETRTELDELEKHFIRVLKTQHPDVGYNICDGGEGFTGPHSEATKRRISEHHKGINYRYVNGYVPQSQEEIAQRRAKCIGRKRTQEQRDNISAGSKGKGTGNSNASGKRTGIALANLQEMNKKRWTPERRQAQAKRIADYNLTRNKNRASS